MLNWLSYVFRLLVNASRQPLTVGAQLVGKLK